MERIVVFTAERKEELADAFIAWYNAQPKKKEAMTMIGKTPNQADTYRRRIRYVPPDAMRLLYLETGDRRFLMSKNEKTQYLRLNKSCVLPSFSDWPDSDDSFNQSQAPPPITTDLSVDDIRKHVEWVARQVEILANLPSGDHAREEARSKLIRPTTELFIALFALDLRFPEDFKKILDNMRLVGQVLGHERR